MSSLTDLYISDSYTGLLHAGGIPLPVSGLITIFDGSGQISALSLGVAGEGAEITGRLTTDNLTVGTLVFPSTPGTVGSLVYQATATTLGFISESDLFPDIITAGTYDNIKNIKVTSQGLVDSIAQWDDDTITSTTYGNAPSNFTTVTFSTNGVWKKISLPGYFGSTAKGGIFFIEPYDNDQPISADQSLNQYIASPDQNAEYKIMTIVGDDGTSHIRYGVQFQCPIGLDDNGNAVIYLKREGDGSNTQQFLISAIAKQH